MNRPAEILKLAAGISNPWGKEPLPDLDEDTLKEIVSILRKNNVSLLRLRERFGETLSGSPLVTYVQEEEAVFHRLRREFERIRVVLEDKGIETIFLKSTGLYPSFPHLSSNLDILVPEDRGEDVRKILKALGYIELLNVEEPKKFLFRKFVLDGPSFTFHLHEQVGWGVPFINTRTIWDHAKASPDDPGVWVPGSVEALLITLAHWFYEDKVLSLGNFYLTAHALRNLPCGLEEAAEGASERGWEDGFVAALEVFGEAWKRIFAVDFFDAQAAAYIKNRLQSESFIRSAILGKVRYLIDKPAEIPFGANKLIYYRKVLTDKKRPVLSRLKDVFTTLLWAIHLKARIRSQKPMLIGVSGCDGSGKTFQVEHLEGAFRTCDVRTKVIWFRGSSSRFMGLFIRLGKRLFSNPSKDGSYSSDVSIREHASLTKLEKVRAQRASLEKPVLRFLYSILYSIDLAAVYCLKARLQLSMGNVVICDRYTSDALVDFAISSGRSIEDIPLALRMLEVFAPKPHLSFVLDVDEAEALRRKPEEGETTHLSESRKMFLAIAEEREKTVVPPDASREAAHEMIVLRSLSAYYRRHGTIVNALFFRNPNQVNPSRWRG